MKAYRICERKGDKVMTLFHGINGTRVLPMNIWIEAIIKPVCDGTRKTSTEYISGFHVFSDKDDCRKFVKKFRKERDLVMVECNVKGKIWKKSHSPSPVLLAEKMKILKVLEKLELKK